jgi:hypothetical protein
MSSTAAPESTFVPARPGYSIVRGTRSFDSSDGAVQIGAAAHSSNPGTVLFGGALPERILRRNTTSDSVSDSTEAETSDSTTTNPGSETANPSDVFDPPDAPAEDPSPEPPAEEPPPDDVSPPDDDPTPPPREPPPADDIPPPPIDPPPPPGESPPDDGLPPPDEASSQATGTLTVRVAKDPADAPGDLVFELRQGASAENAGDTLAIGVVEEGETRFQCVATVPSAVCIQGDEAAYLPAGIHEVCETGRLPGWDNDLDGFVPGEDDGSTECVEVALYAGSEHILTIDHTPPPGGISHTPEYWAAWSSCIEKPTVRPVLDETLESAGPDPIKVGDLLIDSCETATKVLQGVGLDGIDRTDEPDHLLASEFLAARLNLLAGAGSCDVADDAVERAERLLHSMHFTGTGPGTSAPGLLDKAVELTETLTEFNRRALCDEQPGPPIELPTIGVLVPIYWALRRTRTNKKATGHPEGGE